MLVLRSLAQKCKFSTTELSNNLKDQPIAGVNSELIKYELLIHSNKTVKEFIETAKTVEMASEKAPGFVLGVSPSSSHHDTAEFHSVSTARNTIGRAGQHGYYRQTGNRGETRQQRTPNINKSQTHTEASSRQCYCCGKYNHLKFQCSLRFKYCSECGEKGHIYKMCKEIKSIANPKSQSSLKKIDKGIEISGDMFLNNMEACDSSDEREDNRYATDFHVINNNNTNLTQNGDVHPCFETIYVNNVPLSMEIDSGVTISSVT